MRLSDPAEGAGNAAGCGGLDEFGAVALVAVGIEVVGIVVVGIVVVGTKAGVGVPCVAAPPPIGEAVVPRCWIGPRLITFGRV